MEERSLVISQRLRKFLVSVKFWENCLGYKASSKVILKLERFGALDLAAGEVVGGMIFVDSGKWGGKPVFSAYTVQVELLFPMSMCGFHSKNMIF